ncbi:MAG: hypothetical protein FWE97_00830 [Dehalococcoidia bacterium]|nr:hypothetical protein [Dehalococcoidia bacterium]
MNLVIRNNWNRKVSRRDKVYVLGDFADHGFHFWQNKLNGEKVIFKGKSERSGKQSEIITLGNKQFYLTYKPDNVPSGYNGWAITGYIHGANMVNVGRKLFCVTAKTLHYSPINATEVIRLVNKAEAELGS